MVKLILRRREVQDRTGLSCSTLYDWMKQGNFPQSVALGARLVGWTESSIDDWIQARSGKTPDQSPTKAAAPLAHQGSAKPGKVG